MPTRLQAADESPSEQRETIAPIPFPLPAEAMTMLPLLFLGQWIDLVRTEQEDKVIVVKQFYKSKIWYSLIGKLNRRLHWIEDTERRKIIPELAQDAMTNLQRTYRYQAKALPVWWRLLNTALASAVDGYLDKRQCRGMEVLMGDSLDRWPQSNDSSTPHMSRQEMLDELRDLARRGCRLTCEHINIMVASLFDGKTLQQIAKDLEYKSPTTIKNRLDEAKSAIRDFRANDSSI